MTALASSCWPRLRMFLLRDCPLWNSVVFWHSPHETVKRTGSILPSTDPHIHLFIHSSVKLLSTFCAHGSQSQLLGGEGLAPSPSRMGRRSSIKHGWEASIGRSCFLGITLSKKDHDLHPCSIIAQLCVAKWILVFYLSEGDSKSWRQWIIHRNERLREKSHQARDTLCPCSQRWPWDWVWRWVGVTCALSGLGACFSILSSSFLWSGYGYGNNPTTIMIGRQTLEMAELEGGRTWILKWVCEAEPVASLEWPPLLCVREITSVLFKPHLIGPLSYSTLCFILTYINGWENSLFFISWA